MGRVELPPRYKQFISQRIRKRTEVGSSERVLGTVDLTHLTEFLQSCPEAFVSTLAGLACMGSCDAYVALKTLRCINRQFHALVDVYMTPHLIGMRVHPHMIKVSSFPIQLQNRWQRNNPGVDIPAVAWSVYRELEVSHAAVTGSGVTYDVIRRQDEELADAVAACS
jgi:ABC-type xylose transport system permease subunit